MLERTAAYDRAITADARRVLLKAVIDISDPDTVYQAAGTSGEAWFSQDEQAHDKIFELDPYATLEHDRWTLDGSFLVLPDEGAEGQTGLVLDQLSGADGAYPAEQWAELRFSGVSILQACSVYFPSEAGDGVAADFTVEVRQGGTAYYTRTFTGNTERSVTLTGFTVYDPDAIRVTVTRWSVPSRRVRVVEIVAGIYEEWTGDRIEDFALKQQGDVSCVTLPYGTCSIRVDNQDRRFEPRNKLGLFQSLEERQGVDIALGVRLEDGTDEYKRAGVFYQHSGGWKTGDNELTIQWSLVDIIGLLADRAFLPPDTLPDTLGGWIAALVSQLGANFAERYTVDPRYAGTPVAVRMADDLAGMKCGDILRFACMATGTWPRADAETGYLAVEPLWDQGSRITLDNLNAYPTMKANDDLAAVIFTLNDGNGTTVTVSGTATASSDTISINNPFLQTEAQALTAARNILAAYGGNRVEIKGRGDMAGEIGDVDTVWLDESGAVSARRIQQDLSFSNGVLRDCGSVLLQADGAFLFQERAVITEGGIWTAPAGVSFLRLILVGKGEDGARGTDGSWDEAGTDGADGAGGKVWTGTVSINEGQTFQAVFGTDTVFGSYSSANGKVYETGFTDIASGSTYARSGVASPVPGSGDGGAGGKGGVKGNKHKETTSRKDGSTSTKTVIDNYPGEGREGSAGAGGRVVIYWEKEAAG